MTSSSPTTLSPSTLDKQGLVSISVGATLGWVLEEAFCIAATAANCLDELWEEAEELADSLWQEAEELDDSCLLGGVLDRI